MLIAKRHELLMTLYCLPELLISGNGSWKTYLNPNQTHLGSVILTAYSSSVDNWNKYFQENYEKYNRDRICEEEKIKITITKLFHPTNIEETNYRDIAFLVPRYDGSRIFNKKKFIDPVKSSPSRYFLPRFCDLGDICNYNPLLETLRYNLSGRERFSIVK